MLQTRQIFDSDAFTASMNLTTLTNDKYIHKLRMHIKGDMTAAASVSVETLLTILNPLEIRRFGSPIVRIQGADLLALNAHVFGVVPFTWVAGANINDQTKIFGLNVPLGLPAAPLGAHTMFAGRVAVAGVDTETMSMDELTCDKALQDSFYHYVEIPCTSAAALGYGNFVDLPQPGDLQGIMFFSTVIPTVTAELSTVQEVRVIVNGVQLHEVNWQSMKADSKSEGNGAIWSSPGTNAPLDNYAYLDFREDPIPSASMVRLNVNGGVAGSIFRVIPIYKVKA